jgi:hypothetical protein
MKRQRGKWLLGSAILTVALMLVLSPWGQAMAQTYTVDFDNPEVVNQEVTETKEVLKAWCDGNPDYLLSVDVNLDDVEMTTNINYTNGTGTQVIYGIDRIYHGTVRLDVPGTSFSVIGAPPANEIGQWTTDCPKPNYDPVLDPWPPESSIACSPAGYAPGGSFYWALLNTEGVYLNPALNTTGSGYSQSLSPGDPGFNFFKGISGTDTFDVDFTTFASVNIYRSGTAADDNATFATGGMEIIYTCGLPGLICNGKTFLTLDDQPIFEIDEPNILIKAEASFTNDGDFDIIDLVIVDVMSSKLSIVSSTIGMPTESPVGTWTFPTQSLGKGETLNFSYEVQVTGLQEGETATNSISASSIEYNLQTTEECEASIYRRPGPPPPVVPAFNPLGLLVFAGLFPVAWVFISRRRKG